MLVVGDSDFVKLGVVKPNALSLRGDRCTRRAIFFSYGAYLAVKSVFAGALTRSKAQQLVYNDK